MPDNYFAHSKDHPFHISVGAVVLNDDNEVAVHHFSSLERDGQIYTDLYILMRETVEPNESLEATLGRGLEEEMGISAKLEAYLGSLVGSAPYNKNHDQKFQKTTLYFLMHLIEWQESRRHPNDPESGSLIQWLPVDKLITAMQDQGRRFPEREDIDESTILQHAKELLAKEV